MCHFKRVLLSRDKDQDFLFSAQPADNIHVHVIKAKTLEYLHRISFVVMVVYAANTKVNLNATFPTKEWSCLSIKRLN
jgi:hypothetical protein